MTLPTKLPFESDPFRLDWLQDVKLDGKIVRVGFVAPSKKYSGRKCYPSVYKGY